MLYVKQLASSIELIAPAGDVVLGSVRISLIVLHRGRASVDKETYDALEARKGKHLSDGGDVGQLPELEAQLRLLLMS